MPALITTDRNSKYGPKLVTQKYAPLAGLTLARPPRTGVESHYYDELLTFRNALFRSAGLLPGRLTLLTSNWPGLLAQEAQPGRLPPLLVISSNRSDWIARGVAAGLAQADALQVRNRPAIVDETDLNALTALGGQTVSPPVYAPSRLGAAAANRGVYVLVHSREYPTYRDQLAGTGITAIGWAFRRGGGGDLTLAGFGAARYAAIEFAKLVRQSGAPAWGKAWLFDDTVVRFTNFPGFAAVERTMQAGHACAGFEGGTVALTFETTRQRAEKTLKNNTPAGPLTLTTPGIVQQASLWNVAYLQQQNLNFAPSFVTSGEDLSLTNYLLAQGTPFLYYGGISIMKEEAGTDVAAGFGAGAQRYLQDRSQLEQLVADAEAYIGPAPRNASLPPILVTPVKQADGGEQLLSTFVTDRVLPTCEYDKITPDLRVRARCQAVEMVNCAALRTTAPAYLSAAALDTVFRNGGAVQQVVTATL